jgi:hypothetical protein
LLGGLLVIGVGGCTVVGAALYKLTPEQEIKPQFTLADVPTVVLVENYRTPDLSANDSELLARELQSKLEENKVKIKLVKTEKILDLRNSRPKDFGSLSVPQIAKAVGAEQVIYVDLQGSGISSLTGQSMFQGKAAASVKVIDAKTGLTTWPPESAEGLSVSSETNALKGREEGSYASVRTELFNGLATKVARLFHTWKASDDEGK